MSIEIEYCNIIGYHDQSITLKFDFKYRGFLSNVTIREN